MTLKITNWRLQTHLLGNNELIKHNNITCIFLWYIVSSTTVTVVAHYIGNYWTISFVPEQIALRILGSFDCHWFSQHFNCSIIMKSLFSTHLSIEIINRFSWKASTGICSPVGMLEWIIHNTLTANISYPAAYGSCMYCSVVISVIWFLHLVTLGLLY